METQLKVRFMSCSVSCNERALYVVDDLARVLRRNRTCCDRFHAVRNVAKARLTQERPAIDDMSAARNCQTVRPTHRATVVINNDDLDAPYIVRAAGAQ